MNVSHSSSAPYATLQPTLPGAQYAVGTPEHKSLMVYGSVEGWNPISVLKLLNSEWRAHICVYEQKSGEPGCTEFIKEREFAGPLYEHRGVWPMTLLHYHEAPGGWRVLSHNEQLVLRAGDKRGNPEKIAVKDLQSPHKRYESVIEAFYEHSLRGEIEHYYANRPARIDDVIVGLHRKAGQLLLLQEQRQNVAPPSYSAHPSAQAADDVWEDVDSDTASTGRTVPLTLMGRLPGLLTGAWALWRGPREAPSAAPQVLPPAPLPAPAAPRAPAPVRNVSPRRALAGPPSAAPDAHLSAHLARRDKATRNDQQFYG